MKSGRIPLQVALTGATGFVGSYTVRSLVEEGHRVSALVRPGRDATWLEALHVEIFRGDMTDEAALRSFVEGMDVVIHTAYDSVGWDEQRQLDHLHSNIFGSLTLLELARLAGVSQFICTVSTYLLRPDVKTPEEVCHTPIDESSPWTSPWSTYVMHNAILESACQAYSAQFGIHTTRFRCAWIYGIHPDLEKTVWRDIVEHVRSGRTYESTFGRDVVAVQDVARALTAAVGNPEVFGQAFNLCDMFVYNQEVAQVACEVTGSRAEVPDIALPRSAPIRSEKVKTLGVSLHRGLEGIRAYLEELNRMIES